MVQINGTYEPVSNENYIEYIKSFDIADDLANKIVASKIPLIISDAGNDKVVITIKGKAITFVFGKEVAYTLPTGKNVKTVAARSPDSITFKTSLADNPSISEEKVYQFTDSGLTSTQTSYKGLKAVNKYKRV